MDVLKVFCSIFYIKEVGPCENKKKDMLLTDYDIYSQKSIHI